MLFRSLFYNDIELRSVPQDLCCSGDARRMDSTAFVVGRVDRKFGPGPSICLHFVPQGLASVVLPLVRFSRFPQRPQRLKIAFFSRPFTILPVGAITLNHHYPIRSHQSILARFESGFSLCPALVRQFAEARAPHMMN